MSWKIVYTKQAKNEAKKLAASDVKVEAQTLLDIINDDPYQTPPPYERLVGDMTGALSRRINIQHRLVYQVIKDAKTVKVIRRWTHYE